MESDTLIALKKSTDAEGRLLEFLGIAVQAGVGTSSYVLQVESGFCAAALEIPIIKVNKKQSNDIKDFI